MKLEKVDEVWFLNKHCECCNAGEGDYKRFPINSAHKETHLTKEDLLEYAAFLNQQALLLTKALHECFPYS
jgi:hypothetical protein